MKSEVLLDLEQNEQEFIIVSLIAMGKVIEKIRELDDNKLAINVVTEDLATFDEFIETKIKPLAGIKEIQAVCNTAQVY